MDPEVGRYNGGQKLFFWATALAAVGLLLSGVALWLLPQELALAVWVRQVSRPAHDLAFIGFFVFLVAHVYLGTAAEPGTFRSMVHGRVTRAWAKVHHARWYREVTGGRD